MPNPQYNIPKGVHPTACLHEYGYLDELLPLLTSGDTITTLDDVGLAFDVFVPQHEFFMLYKPWGENLWFLDNHAYEDVSYVKAERTLWGKPYPVTHWDISLEKGKPRQFMQINPEMSPLAIPMYLDGKYKGLVLAQGIAEDSARASIQLLVGNNNTRKGLLDMPRYNLDARIQNPPQFVPKEQD